MGFFRNSQEGRPRAFWRLLFQFLLFVAAQTILGNLALLAFLPLAGGSSGGLAALSTSPAFIAAGGVAGLLATVGSVWFAGRFFDRRPFSSFGLRLNRDWWIELGFGLFVGALLMTTIFLVELAFGWVSVTGAFEPARGSSSFFPAILAPLVLFLCVGFYEELLSRGYQLTNAAEGLNYPWLGGPRGAVLVAWVLSSSAFGLAHLSNPGATLVSTANIALAGILLGVGYVLTGRLAVSIGLHITWNFFQGNVFGFPVSGFEPIGATFVRVEQGGPTVFTGGGFGPEAGLLGIAAMLTGTLLIVLWVRLRHGEVAIQDLIAEPPARKPEVPS